MERYTIDGIEVSLETLHAALPDGVHCLRVSNCEWRALLELLPRSHGELGCSIEVTPLRCTGNRLKFEHDLPHIQALFAHHAPNPESCLLVLHLEPTAGSS